MKLLPQSIAVSIFAGCVGLAIATGFSPSTTSNTLQPAETQRIERFPVENIRLLSAPAEQGGAMSADAPPQRWIF